MNTQARPSKLPNKQTGYTGQDLP